MSHHALLPLRFGSLAVCLCVSVVGCSGQADLADVQLLSGGDGTAWWEGGDNGQAGPATNQPQDGPRDEVCDGLDNDLDGAVDEELGGEPCTGTSGAVGVWTCTAGEMVCFECTPGEVNERGCGCGGVDTVDACNDSGRWVSGVCNGCADLDETGCGVDAACKPGEERIMRCDLCAGTGTPGCGATCMGALHRCSSNCEWVKIGECRTYDPQCDRDYSTIKACGNCGRREVRCDGCFLTWESCQDQGACEPGDTYRVPCFENDCRYGWTATVSCNDQCSWDVGTCDGCTPGTVENVTTLCVPGHAECGERVDRVTCVGQSDVQSCENKELVQGVENHQTISDECPGVVAPNFCTPNQVTSEQVSCGPNSCGYVLTYTHTCFGNGCGESVTVSGSCPECRVGEVQTAGCDPGGGGCGTQTRSCTSSCGWGAWGACEAYTCPPAPPPPPDEPPPPPPPPDEPGDPPPDDPPPPPPPPRG